MVRLTPFALATLSLLSPFVEASNVLELTPKNFDFEIAIGQPVLVEFFAPWCGHCKSLAPIYEELADSFAGKPVRIAKVDADEHKDLGKRFGVNGFPTLKWFAGKSKNDEPEQYSGGRDLDSLQKFIQEKSGVMARKKPDGPTEVKHLTDSTFDDVVGKDKDVFVAFTAPWCGHCKSLAPEWEKLASDYAPDDKVIIAKVDAEKHKKVAGIQDVTSYPTIKYFKAGSTTGEEYNAGRDEASMLRFVNIQATLNRIAGGGLDENAGTIEKLDEIVKNVDKNTLESVKTKVAEATEGLQGKAHDYYLRVLKKMEENENYVEKEVQRLTGLLDKGGLVRAKEDDFTRRINVLKRFAGIGASVGHEEL